MKKALALALLLAPAAAQAQAVVSFKDPVGDDKGPGTYAYPTDSIYTRGSFDMTSMDVRKASANLEFAVTVRAPLADHWRMGTGFSTQMVFVFIRTGAGKYLDGLPGLNIRFARPGWDKVVILSPQQAARVQQEVSAKAAAFGKDVLIPQRTRGAGMVITGSVPLASLGASDPAKWSYQVVMASNEGFPSGNSLMVRTVNEYEGQHRFGGGNDSECDANVLDVLAGTGIGAPAEAAAQAKMLAYQCDANGKAVIAPTLTMLRK